jgi:hypothetical protein
MAQAAVPIRGTSPVHLGWLTIGALVVVAALVGGLAGYFIKEGQVAPANPDQALAAQLDAAWSTTYDATKIAALYAPNATFYDMIANETSSGLEAIQAKASTYLTSYHFVVTTTSAPIRQGDFVATFYKYGPDGQATNSGLGVLQIKDGKVLNQWVYPAQ